MLRLDVRLGVIAKQISELSARKINQSAASIVQSLGIM